MTNFERVMQCKNSNELLYICKRLEQWAIYANGRLLNTSNPDEVLEWLNKESDTVDTICFFNMEARDCPYCGAVPDLISPPFIDKPGYYMYQCSQCGYWVTPDDNGFPKTEIGALLLWNR